jgi:phage baseplate assembly protein W
MNDIFLEWGGDLATGSGGDLAVAVNSDMQRQRVCRRLLTNAGDYLWNPDYGGGLGRFVGSPASAADIEAVVRSQLALEAAVPQSPAPVVATSIADRASGYVVTNIAYADPAGTGQVNFNVSAG